MRRAFTNGRYLAAAVGMNVLVVPVVVWGLTRFLPREPVLIVGAFMIPLTPCIDYVITVTDLAGGDVEQITVTTPALMLAQLLLLPASLSRFMRPTVVAVIDPGRSSRRFCSQSRSLRATNWSRPSS
jgi:ACR3 family arsenite efflux pump ArsB